MRQVLLDREFWNAIGRARFEIPVLLKDPDFVEFVRAYHLSSADDGDERFEEAYAAALIVGRNLENIGNMVRNGLTDKRIFLEQYANLVVMARDATEPLLMIRREAEASDTPWEDFEYLTVLSRRWLAEARSSYPKTEARILPSYAQAPEAEASYKPPPTPRNAKNRPSAPSAPASQKNV